ncbi:MAG: DUF5131 family protein [Methylococcaceae bacterium]
MNKTDIEYLDYTWNPLAMRCTPVSEGCANCWHLKFANRHAHNPQFSQEMRKAYAGGLPYLREDELEAPYKKKRSRIGVQFMGDIYHEKNSFETIWRIYDVMSGAAQLKGHDFFVLTKRLERALEFFHWVKAGLEDNRKKGMMVITWPSPKVWLGASVENQEQADKRIPILLQIPAAVRFVSCEPLLSFLDLRDYIDLPNHCCPGCGWVPLEGMHDFIDMHGQDVKCIRCDSKMVNRGLDWIICGGESGPKARPLHPDWARGVRDQCVEAGVSFFFKQFGEWEACPPTRHIRDTSLDGAFWVDYKGNVHDYVATTDGVFMRKVGKKAAGRKLDGKIHSEFPGVV